MDPVVLKKIEEIFHAALEIVPRGRATFLDERCGSDAQLRREVESLLEFESTRDHFIDDTPEALAAEMFAAEHSPESLIGRSILHYKVIKILGIGGMGEVYLAEDLRLNRKVALKILPDAFASDQDRMERFILEARSASSLNHPNIITIHEIGEFDGKKFLTTEFIDGKTLKVLIAPEKLTLASVLDIAIQIASALEDAHAAGIVHRDIKPDNVMVRPNGLVKILDFGVAKHIGPPESNTVPTQGFLPRSGGTMAGMIIGTADYMSPEQASGTAVDTRSDIFSFGSVMYEMLSGSKPFIGENAIDTINAILHSDPIPLSEVAPDLPPAILSTVHKCLSKAVDKRYQLIKEVLSDLRTAKRRLDYEEIESGLTPLEREMKTGSSKTAVTDSGHRANGVSAQVSAVDMPAAITLEHLPHGSSKPWQRPRNLLVAVFLLVMLLALGGVIGYQNLTAKTRIASIAVMPFINESGDPAVEYLSEGMTENLIRSLSTISDLSIKARSTVFTYKGKVTSPKAIGNELNVDAVLLGRLEQSVDALRLSLELVDASTQDVLWSAKYSRNIGDLIVLQRDIARDVAELLRPALTSADQRKVAQTYSTSSEAQQLYLKGRFHWNKRNVRDFERAMKYFDQAVEMDPNYALAYTGSADTYALLPLYGNFRPTEYIPKAKQAALKALELDKDLAEAHASLGYIKTTYDFDWDSAEREYQAALRLRPNYATAHQWYAEHLAFRGRTDEALAEISIALELDPFSLVINRMKGNILGFANRYDEAIDQLKKTVELYPDSPVVRFNLGEAYAAKEMYPEAIEQYLNGFKLDGRKNHEIRRYENAFKLKGWQGFWMEYLASLIMLQEAVLGAKEPMYFDNESLAYAYAATKNKEKAIEYLYKAFEARDPSLVTIRTSEVYDLLKDEPRFTELIGRIGLPK
jgi:eukaryotic-like serine/threonine-protein kinase